MNNNGKLTHNDVLLLTNKQRKSLLDYYQDKVCNIDYINEPIESDRLQHNINLLESKILYNEY